MAAGAQDMLEAVRITNNLPDAIADCTAVVASTARVRGYDLPELSPEETAEMLIESAKRGPAALIFGPERMGLHNDDIRHAKYRVTIPANPEYNSLNMAAAVQTLSYEIYKASGTNNSLVKKSSTHAVAGRDAASRDRAIRDLPSSADIERLYEHIECVLKDINFLRPHQGETMQRIRHLITRAEPDTLELNILRGILSSVDKKSRKT